MEVQMCRNSVPHINNYILSKYGQHPVQDNQFPERAGHLGTTLHPSVRHLYTNHILHHLDIRRKHFVYLTGFRAYYSFYYNGKTHVPIAWESNSSHRPRSGQRHYTINLCRSIYAVHELYSSLMLHSVILVSL